LFRQVLMTSSWTLSHGSGSHIVQICRLCQTRGWSLTLVGVACWDVAKCCSLRLLLFTFFTEVCIHAVPLIILVQKFKVWENFRKGGISGFQEGIRATWLGQLDLYNWSTSSHCLAGLKCRCCSARPVKCIKETISMEHLNHNFMLQCITSYIIQKHFFSQTFLEGE